MGIINHNVVVATTADPEELQRVQIFIKSLPTNLNNLFVVKTTNFNGISTIILVPDGGVEGSPRSNVFDKLRSDFIDIIKKDEESWYYVEIGFGEYGQKILQGNCENVLSDDIYYK